MEDLVIVESNDYAQVVFDEIKECFAENQPLECHFTLNELLKADASDWIGIYKVGFVHHKDHFCANPIKIEAIHDNKGTIVFKGKSADFERTEYS